MLGHTKRIPHTGNTVSTVNNDTGQVSFVHFTARPRCRKRQDGLNGDIPGECIEVNFLSGSHQEGTHNP